MDKKETAFMVKTIQDARLIEAAGGMAVVANENAKLKIENGLPAGCRKVVLMFEDAGIMKQSGQLPVACLDVPYGYGSPADFYRHDPAGFRDFVEYFQARDVKADYSMESSIWYFRNIMNQPKHYEAKTGFALFDDEAQGLCGGIHEGLHVLGAVSSNGKSSFFLQLADQIADRGNDVLFFSLEQPSRELVAKSLSRETFLAHKEKTENGFPIARDASQILNNNRYFKYSRKEKDAIADAIDRYQQYAGHMYIIDADYAIRHGEELNMGFIEQMVGSHIHKTGNLPVVMVDYLQILPGQDHKRGKDAVDYNVERLKLLSVKYKIPVMVISSFNRLSYTQPVDMTSFKESGLIEYSADFLYGLQWSGMEYRDDEDEKKRKERIKKLNDENRRKKMNGEPVAEEFKCLKQRNGTTFSMQLDFYTRYSLFSETRMTTLARKKIRV